jgi:nicotinate-nucleotide adenylyltransferase
MSHLLLYGGTFDPIHHGHLITARCARELLSADQVLLVPARISPHKQDRLATVSDADRLAMIKMAIAGQPDFAVDDRELHRTGPSYTVDTLAELRTSRPQDRFTLLVGLDQLPKLHTWHKIHQLLADAKFALLGRPPHDPEPAFAAIEGHLGSAIAQNLRPSLLSTPLIDISATDIRRRIHANLPITYLVPESVAAYIDAHRLYRHVLE